MHSIERSIKNILHCNPISIIKTIYNTYKKTQSHYWVDQSLCFILAFVLFIVRHVQDYANGQYVFAPVHQ